MTGTLFLPRQTVLSIVQFITPIVQPVPPGGDSAENSQARLTFLYGPGNGFIIYIAGLVILIFCASQILRFVRRKQMQEAQTLTTGLAIIVLGALPLVAIIFSFPRWGYDFYFDSRHYYNPNVGAAIVFPFLLFALAKFVSKSLRIRKISLVVLALFIVWLINNMYVFNLDIKYNTQNFQPDRREVVRQLKEYLPILPQKTVFYMGTDGLSAYGPILPFQTGVPQALTVVYYDKSPLPDSFFDKPLFNGKGEGYQYSEGRGFGYYTSKKNLSEALSAHKFKTSDIYAFYYKAKDIHVLNITSKVRTEMEDYLMRAKENSDWKAYRDLPTGLSFYYPSQTEIEEIPGDSSQSTARFFMISNPNFVAKMTIFNIAPTFVLDNYLQIASGGKLGVANSKKVSYDKFHYNEGVILNNNDNYEYILRINDELFILETKTIPNDTIEKIVGSVEIIKPK